MRDIRGQFNCIESFAIRSRNEFYRIGQTINGNVQEDWFINIPLSHTLALTLRITKIEHIEIASEKEKTYILLVVQSDDASTDFLLGEVPGYNSLDITIDGED